MSQQEWQKIHDAQNGHATSVNLEWLSERVITLHVCSEKRNTKEDVRAGEDMAAVSEENSSNDI